MNTLYVADGAPPSLPGITEAAPDLDWWLLAPFILVFGAGVLAVLFEAFVPKKVLRPVQITLAAATLLVTFLIIVAQVGAVGDGTLVAGGVLAVDRVVLFLQGTITVLALISLMLIAERRDGRDAFSAQAATVPGSEEERRHILAGSQHTEVYPLVLFAVLGMLLFPAANDFLTMFIALEVMSLPLYLLCGLARRRRLFSQEAAVKYFLLGAFSSAFFLFGIAMVYGYAGSVNFTAIREAVDAGGAEIFADGNGEPLLVMGIGLVAIGLLFKVGAVPFHSWKPDVYQGAPTPITALMASCTLVAAFGALLRVFFVPFGGSVEIWEPMLWTVAILTMVAAAVIAVTQRDIKRLLAYSSVVHAGFILTAVVAASAEGLAGAMFYLAAYGFTTLGAFAIVTLVRTRDGGQELGDLEGWAGLGRRAPGLALALSLFLLAFAGIPLTSGFIGKFAVFGAAIEAGATPLVVVGVLSSAITAYFYIRIIVVMFFRESEGEGPTVARAGALTGGVITVGVAATLALGIFPGQVLDNLLPPSEAGQDPSAVMVYQDTEVDAEE
ncbi:NADH-quinone oxidoreductase subunit NuoN [Nocardiopsis sp. MG754419]|uniref:NADH-quinone oxidoreductase subunit NuoN n=1 Tax=Nocardiopsis sp. MG754419 TaxID=2259865 RepID=UPI001BAD8753|nr:NADH-quinone oxidoreductase subunit NuoN [Nocardiopsis sp. MG754419]MBR8744894.1 NADH-quinone oxidoreductase subunit NuoN [Nocardiopsis sp. MG754419]